MLMTESGTLSASVKGFAKVAPRAALGRVARRTPHSPPPSDQARYRQGSCPSTVFPQIRYISSDLQNLQSGLRICSTLRVTHSISHQQQQPPASCRIATQSRCDCSARYSHVLLKALLHCLCIARFRSSRHREGATCFAGAASRRCQHAHGVRCIHRYGGCCCRACRDDGARPCAGAADAAARAGARGFASPSPATQRGAGPDGWHRRGHCAAAGWPSL